MGDDVLGNLDGVEGGALADLVADGPERDAAGIGEVVAQTSYVNGILAGEVDDLPEQAFMNVGTIDEAVAKAKGEKA